MDENKHPHDPRLGHETTDVNVWAVGKFGIALVVVCVISIALLWGLLKYFQSEQATPVANTVDPIKLFPQPRLQRTPVLDLRAIRAAEDKVLDSYGWVDQKQGWCAFRWLWQWTFWRSADCRLRFRQAAKRHPRNEKLCVYCGAGNFACSRLSGGSTPAESRRAARIGCPTLWWRYWYRPPAPSHSRGSCWARLNNRRCRTAI